MANVTFLSTTPPKMMAEAARRYMIAERALVEPEASVTMTFGDSLLTINGSLAVSADVDVSTGNFILAFTNSTVDATPVLTGTSLAAITADSLAEVLWAAVIRLDAAEASKLANAGTLPAGVGSTYSIADGVATFTAVLPIVYSLDANANQVATVTNYLA